MENIKNREELTEKLAGMLAGFEKDMRPYQTDVYLYTGDDGMATLALVANPGGTSYLDDGGVVIYTDGEHHETLFDFFADFETADLAEILGMTAADLVAAAAEHAGLDDDETPGWHDIRDYLMHDDGHMAALQAAYDDVIDDMAAVHAARAEDIISSFLDN